MHERSDYHIKANTQCPLRGTYIVEEAETSTATAMRPLHGHSPPVLKTSAFAQVIPQATPHTLAKFRTCLRIRSDFFAPMR